MGLVDQVVANGADAPQKRLERSFLIVPEDGDWTAVYMAMVDNLRDGVFGVIVEMLERRKPDSMRESANVVWSPHDELMCQLVAWQMVWRGVDTEVDFDGDSLENVRELLASDVHEACTMLIMDLSVGFRVSATICADVQFEGESLPSVMVEVVSELEWEPVGPERGVEIIEQYRDSLKASQWGVYDPLDLLSSLQSEDRQDGTGKVADNQAALALDI